MTKTTQDTFTDNRLPKGYTVFLNSFGEYVVCNEFGFVARVGNPQDRDNVQASYTLEGAIQHWLKQTKSTGPVD